MKKYYIFVGIVIIIVAALGAWVWYGQNNQISQNKLISKVFYKCDNGKTIDASYYEGALAPKPQPGEMPTPTGSVALVLSDSRQMTLPQTISASGVRYANSDESLIFWNKGETAFIMENNQQTYSGCVDAASKISDYKNGTYKIDGKNITLLDGVAETEIAPGSVSKLITRYFGNEAIGDLNADGLEDVAFLLTQDGGGSGIFLYAVVALKTSAGYQGTNAVFLGDRIAPQTTEIRNGEIIVNYVERKPGEPMTVRPSIGVSKYLKVENGLLVIVNK